mgnify:CR=1 FL=1|jgi:hypothetical protein|eukprot:g4113.t1
MANVGGDNDNKRRKVEETRASIKELLAQDQLSLGEIVQECADGMVQSYQRIDEQLKVGGQWLDHIKNEKTKMLERANFNDLVKELKEYYQLDEERKALEMDIESTDQKLIDALEVLNKVTDQLGSAISDIKKGVFYEGAKNHDGTPYQPATQEVSVDDIVDFAERLSHFTAPHGKMFPTDYNKDTSLLYQQPKHYPSS